jgi:hypothetical protein
MSGLSLAPDAMQRVFAVHRRAGAFAKAVFAAVPVLRRIMKACCAAPGTNAVIAA